VATGTDISRVYIQLNSWNLLEFRWLLHKTEAVVRPGHSSSQIGRTHNPYMFISWLCYVDSSQCLCCRWSHGSNPRGRGRAHCQTHLFSLTSSGRSARESGIALHSGRTVSTESDFFVFTSKFAEWGAFNGLFYTCLKGVGRNSQGTGQWNYQMRFGQLYLTRKRGMISKLWNWSWIVAAECNI